MSYNGHPNRNAWNVALWIGNDEGLYREAMRLKRRHGTKRAAELFREFVCAEKTPNGAPWSLTNIRRAIAAL